ncbi:MAG TPA: SRPBCC domain-containing protein [Streptosporangiaceae bacterium]|nr:SRPBCC domain-containing protein [Streptosporangiaceae bacterium]
MRVSGAVDVRVPAEAVRAALSDGGLLSRAVPWLDEIEFADDGCRFAATVAIAAVSGSYAGEARVVERTEPGARVLRVTAAGARGTITADLTIRLASAGDDGAEVSYTADADVAGAIAGIGQRMLAGVAKRLAADAIGGLGAALAEAAAAPDSSQPDAAVANVVVAEAAIEQARLGVGLHGERAPADTRSMPGVSPGLVGAAAAVVAGIALGVFLGRRLMKGR